MKIYGGIVPHIQQQLSDAAFAARAQAWDQRYDASVRFQHLSNGGLVQPNPGINFVQLRLAYHF